MARALEVSHSGVDDYSIVVPGALLRQMNEAQQNFNTLLGSIATISLLAGGIGIMNILLATVSERRREIGIRRAVGASQAQILIQFLSESLLLTLTGGMFGLLAGIILVRMLALYSSWETAIVPWAAFVSLGMALLTGLFFGLYPAFHASKVDPIVALRYE
ncbi:MAG: ABC transporter permease [Nitrospinota bacterium]